MAGEVVCGRLQVMAPAGSNQDLINCLASAWAQLRTECENCGGDSGCKAAVGVAYDNRVAQCFQAHGSGPS